MKGESHRVSRAWRSLLREVAGKNRLLQLWPLMDHYCQLLVDPNGRVCLPFGWDGDLLIECGAPATFWLEMTHDDGEERLWVYAKHWDRIEAQKRESHDV